MKTIYSNPKKYSHSLPAFTIAEMLTSIFIIVMITGIFMANYRANNRRTDLIMSAQKIVADIRGAQNNTLGLVKYGEEFPSGGWAVNFDTTSDETRSRYIVFADLDSPASNEPGREAPAKFNFGRLNPEEMRVSYGAKVVDLPRGIVIESIQTSDSNSTSWVNINFLPPDPATHIFDGSYKSSWTKIKLKDITDDTTKTISVNFLGLVEVID